MKHKATDACGLFSLGQLSAFCQRLNVLIAVDSGPIYIANAVGTAVIDIAGPIDVREQPPQVNNCKIVQPDLPCIPCSYVIHTSSGCTHPSKICLEKTE